MSKLRERWRQFLSTNNPEIGDELKLGTQEAMDALIDLRDEGGEVAFRAGHLLLAIQSQAMIETCLHLFEAGEPNDEMIEVMAGAVGFLGEACVGDLAAAYHRAGSHSKPYLAEVLSMTGLEDDRVLDMLVDFLSLDPGYGATCLAEYGDERGLPALYRALDSAVVATTNDPLDNHPVLDLAAAIEILGGELTPAQQAKREQAQSLRPPPKKKPQRRRKG